MELDNLFAEFSKEVKADTYQSRIKAFKEFIIDEKKINDGTYVSYFKAMSITEMLESLDYFIRRNHIKKKSVAKHYCEMIKKFFHFLRAKGIENNELFLCLGRKGNDSFDSITQNYVTADKRLKKAEPNEEYEDDEIITLIEKANGIINNSLLHENELFAGKKKYSFRMYTAAIGVKLIIFSGTSFNNISKIELQDFDIQAKTIKISGYELHLPIDLFLQLKEYMRIRNSLKTKNTKLLVRSDGTNLKGVSDLEAALVLENREKGNVTGITKNIIIKMIRSNIRLNIIMKLTDAGMTNINYCIDVINEEAEIEDNLFLDSKIRSFETFALL